MTITLKTADGKFHTTTSIEQVENGYIIRRVDIFENRKDTTIEEYDLTWGYETIRYFFTSKVNALITNGYKIEDIQ